MTDEQKIKRLLRLIAHLRCDCQMALDGRWDKSDEGFQDSIDNIDTILDEVGLEVPVIGWEPLGESIRIINGEEYESRKFC